MAMISIIIPTLNEENNLKELLSSIKSQDFFDYEIIVSDAGSKDKTLEVAKEYNAKITKGGLPAKGRNEGAKIANGEFFLFLDADVYLEKDFIKKSMNEIKKRELEIASFRILPKKGKIATLLFNLYYNYPMLFLEKILPHSAIGIIIKKETFFKINGFDETILLAEDHDFGRRASKVGKFGIIKSATVYTSTRRFEEDGWFSTFIRYSLCELYIIFIGPVRKDIFKYKFNHYSKKDGRKS